MEHQNWKIFEKELHGLYKFYKEAQLALAAAEEFAGTKYVASIVNEFRAVLHHLMEAFNEFEQNPDGLGWKKEFIKAKEEHLMRAIFDAYHLSIALQQKEIREHIEEYDASVILEVFPEFYKEIRPYFAALNVKLADARAQRDENSLISFKEALIKTQDYKIRCDIAVEEIITKKKQRVKKERNKNIYFEKINDFFNKSTFGRTSIITSFIITIFTILVGLVELIPDTLSDEGKSSVLISLAIVAAALFITLLSVQLYMNKRKLYISKRKQGEKTEKLNSILINEYTSAIKESIVTSK